MTPTGSCPRTRPGLHRVFALDDVHVGPANGRRRDADDRLARPRVAASARPRHHAVLAQEHHRLHRLHGVASTIAKRKRRAAQTTSVLRRLRSGGGHRARDLSPPTPTIPGRQFNPHFTNRLGSHDSGTVPRTFSRADSGTVPCTSSRGTVPLHECLVSSTPADGGCRSGSAPAARMYAKVMDGNSGCLSHGLCPLYFGLGAADAVERCRGDVAFGEEASDHGSHRDEMPVSKCANRSAVSSPTSSAPVEERMIRTSPISATSPSHNTLRDLWTLSRLVEAERKTCCYSATTGPATPD